MPSRTDSDDFADDIAGSAVESFLELTGSVLPGAGPLAKRLAGKVREEVRRNRSKAIRAAEAASGLSREDLAERIAADARLVPLATRLLYAAGMSGHDQTLRAMGTAFGDAVRDRNGLEECELILTALDGLTDTHAMVLRLMTQELPLVGGRPGHWTVPLVVERSELPAGVATLCLAGLVTRGLVGTSSSFLGGNNLYDLTDLGRLLLDVLSQYSGDKSSG
jgi:hypothetical protein